MRKVKLFYRISHPDVFTARCAPSFQWHSGSVLAYPKEVRAIYSEDDVFEENVYFLYEM